MKGERKVIGDKVRRGYEGERENNSEKCSNRIREVERRWKKKDRDI